MPTDMDDSDNGFDVEEDDEMQDKEDVVEEVDDAATPPEKPSSDEDPEDHDEVDKIIGKEDSPEKKSYIIPEHLIRGELNADDLYPTDGTI